MNFKRIILVVYLLCSALLSASESSAIKLFEPFNIKNHKKYLSLYGEKALTSKYHQYIKEKKIGDDCRELIGTCEYYLCREKEQNCGAKGYLLGFGYQYCSDSLKRLVNEVSPYGKLWLQTTATCLQEKMEDIPINISCSELKRRAVSDHDKCYDELSFCRLSPLDIFRVLQMIKPALLESGVVIEGIQVLGHCVGL